MPGLRRHGMPIKPAFVMKPAFSAESSARILSHLYGYQLAHCLHVVSELNIAELLFESPRPVDELAALTGTHAPSLYRVLRVTAAAGVFEETEGRVFRFTPDATALHGDAEGSVKPYFQAIMGEHSHAFANLLHSVRTGETAFDAYYSTDVWEFYDTHPEEAIRFNKAMAGLTQYYSHALLPAYDFSRFRTVIDIGGGNGALLFAILGAYPTVYGAIFDAPAVIPETEKLILDSPFQDRCTTIAGNFFDAIPIGYDAYLLKFILHDWSDDDCVVILRNCAEVMAVGNRVLILDSVIPSGNYPHAGKYTDVTMLACTRGRERSAVDFRQLIEAAGLHFAGISDIGQEEMYLIEAVKA